MSPDATPAAPLWRHRSFARYWVSRVSSTVAMQMQNVAVAWQMYDLTHNPFDLGLVGLTQFIPAALFVLVAGHVADRYDRRRIDGIWMNDCDVTATIQKLLGMSYEARVNNSCISVERADLVLAGCAILDAIRNAFPMPRLRVADRGLREGMLVEMMREDGALRAC